MGGRARLMNATIEIPAPVTKSKIVEPAKRKILLADDDPAIRRILSRLLAEEDYFVRTAANGVEALELATATKFDLVLLDLNLPVKDGWETFVRLSTKNLLLPFILITGRPGQFFSALAAGVGALLEKPLNFTELFYTIHNLLEEPAEARLARSLGRASMFGYVPLNG